MDRQNSMYSLLQGPVLSSIGRMMDRENFTYSLLQGPVLAGLWTDRTPCIHCYRVQYSPVEGQTELHVFNVTGSSIGGIMDRQNSMYLLLQGPVFAGWWTDGTPCIHCYRVQYLPDDGQTELHVFNVTGSSIGRMMDRQNFMYSLLQGPVLAGWGTDRTPRIHCYTVQYWPDDGQTKLRVFTITGSSIGQMMDRQNSMYSLLQGPVFAGWWTDRTPCIHCYRVQYYPVLAGWWTDRTSHIHCYRVQYWPDDGQTELRS